MKVRVWAVAFTAALALSGCETSQQPGTSGGPHGADGTAVTTVVLTNGVTCRVMDGNGAALSCDWQGPRQPAASKAPQGDSGSGIELAVLRNGVACAAMRNANEPGSNALSCDWLGVRQPAAAKDPAVSGVPLTLITYPDGTECGVMDGSAALSCGKPPLS